MSELPEEDPYVAPAEEVVSPVPDSERPVEFEEVYRRFVALMGEDRGPLLFVWIGVSVVALLTSLSGVFVQNLGLGFFFGGLSSMLLSSLSTVAYFGSLAAVYRCAERGGELSLDEAIDISIEHLGSLTIVAVVFHIAISIGSLLLVFPGLLVAVVLYPAPFLGAMGFGPVEAFEKAFAWTKKHYMIGVITFAIWGAVVLVLGAALFFIFYSWTPPTAPDSGMVAIGALFTTLLLWGFLVVLGYFSWLWVGAMLTSIAQKEGLAAPGMAGAPSSPASASASASAEPEQEPADELEPAPAEESDAADDQELW